MNDKPALLGGKKLARRDYFKHDTGIGAEERALVLDALDSGVLSGFLARFGPRHYGGPMVRRLEAEFADLMGTRFAVSFNSATSALHAAVAASGCGPGDEVVTSPFTMAASASCILMANAVPVFADVDPDIFCISPDSVRERLTQHTKAVLAVSIFGHPADLDGLEALCHEHGLFLIEDAAQAPLARCNGRMVGTVGRIGVFSLNAHKAIQCGEGGLAVTSDDELYERLCLVRNHGEAIVEDMGYADIAGTLGWNYRLPELSAAAAVAQLEKLPALTAHRRKLAEELNERLAVVSGLSPGDGAAGMRACLLSPCPPLRRRFLRAGPKSVRPSHGGRRLPGQRRLHQTHLSGTLVPTSSLLRPAGVPVHLSLGRGDPELRSGLLPHRGRNVLPPPVGPQNVHISQHIRGPGPIRNRCATRHGVRFRAAAMGGRASEVNALFFAQDVGSAQFLGPVVRALVGEQRPLRVFARLGGEVGFDGEGVDFQRLDTRPEGMDPVEAREWLSSMNPDLLVCGASGPRPDLTACNLTLAARLLSIPCAGFLDHWKGWNRFSFQGDPVRFLPRRLGVPDSRSLSCLAAHGVPEDRMFIAGHPWLEARRTRPLDSKLRASVRARLEAGDDEPVLVLVSQPLPGGSAHSLSKARLRGKSLPDLLAEAFTSVAGGGVRVLRPHPREASSFDRKSNHRPARLDRGRRLFPGGPLVRRRRARRTGQPPAG